MKDALRTDLVSEERILESLEWHKKILQETEQRFTECKERVLDWYTAKEELWKYFDSVIE